jgi:uncharacterized protein DUF3617
MAKKVFVLGTAFLVTFCLGVALAGPDMNPGKWEITTETEMVGMSGMTVPPVTHVQCLKKGDLVPQSKEASQECQVTDVKQKGDTISWKIICSGQNGQMDGTGTVSYRGDSMEGTMDMVIKGAGMRIKNKIRGRRIGDCE